MLTFWASCEGLFLPLGGVQPAKQDLASLPGCWNSQLPPLCQSPSALLQQPPGSKATQAAAASVGGGFGRCWAGVNSSWGNLLLRAQSISGSLGSLSGHSPQ